MKAEELMIGNYLHSKLTNQDFSVSAEDIMCISQGLDDGNVHPIELTEKWLVKFGFERDGKYDWELNANGVLFYGMCDDRQPINTSIGIFNLPDSKIKIKHVHQLQNLYFALTSQHLTLNQ